MVEVSGVKIFTAVWSPGVVAADTAMDIPAAFPEMQAIIGGEQMASSSGVSTVITLVAAVPTTTLGTGYVSQVDGNSIKMGDANNAKDTVSLTYRYV
ncbi:hypothetical protein KKF61_08195 [Patescibacteria group bacterium]|nr:hypothetical protein [Patescibacteria group bacterium]